MKSHPILYSAPMARANIDGRKTQTRRIVDFPLVDADGQHPDPDRAWIDASYQKPEFGNTACLKLPYGPEGGDLSTVQRFFPKWEVGDHLWGKETFAREPMEDGSPFAYRASGDKLGCKRWTPSIFMPREASRIHQEILSLRCERVRSITAEDAIAEGIHHVGRSKLAHLKIYSVNPDADPDLHYTKDSETYDSPVMCYSDLWNSINLKPSPIYQRNPETGKKEITSYISYPWSMHDFENKYPQVGERGTNPTYRGKPITILPNPWVWVIGYKNLKP